MASCKISEKAPAILLLRDFDNGSDEQVIENLAKKGYIVLSVDIAGKDEGKELFTEYPESLNYANYSLAKDSLYSVTEDVNDTCWYEWTAVVRYALKYLRGLDCVSSVGGSG